MVELLSLRPLWANAIRGGIEQGLSGRSILSAGRSAGLRIRNETFWSMFRTIGGWRKFELPIAALRPETPIPPTYIVEGGDWQVKPLVYRGYIVTERIEPTTGEIVTTKEHFDLGTDYLTSKADVSQSMAEFAREYGKLLDRIEIVGVTWKPGSTYAVPGEI